MGGSDLVMSRHVRAYRALLRVYPRRFRGDYRDEMTRLFADQLRDVRSTEGGVGVLRLWARSLVDLVATASAQHLEPEEVLVASPVGTSEPPRLGRGPTARRRVVLIALIPLWLLIALTVTAPGYMDPVVANPPGIVGLPAGIVVQGLALGWMALGVGVVRATSSNVGWIAAMGLFAMPATAVILLTPPIVLALQNLAI
jgi:hypothetical protein